MTPPITSPLLAALAAQVTESTIQRWWWKAKKQHVGPWLTLLVGSDDTSCGVSIYACHRGEDGGKTAIEPLVALRWRKQPETVEDLVLLAQKALRELAFERGWRVAE